MEDSNNQRQKSLFPQGELSENNNFSGKVGLHNFINNESPLNCTVTNVTFEARCRNHWHQHPGGQILIVTDGEGYYQEKGKPIRLLFPGDVVEIAPHVVHWHGATPNSKFAHIAINPNLQLGSMEWLQPVTEEEYNSYKP